MPGILVHYSFALKAISSKEEANKEAVYLGAQGPDPFFYFGQTPIKKRNDADLITGLGGALHHSDIAPIYLSLINYAKKNENKDLLLAYIDGLFMHYSVDSTFHPYVFSQSGFDDKGELDKYYSWSHMAYESLLDVQWGNKLGTFINPVKAIKIKNEETVKAISLMWFNVVGKPLTKDSYYEAWVDFCASTKMFYSPTGIKRIFFRLAGKHSSLMGLSYPHRLKKFEPLDQLNETNREWPNCVSGEKRKDSVASLWEEALAKEALFQKAVYEDSLSIDELESLVNKIDHDGFPLQAKKKFFDLAWKKMKKEP